MGDQVKVKVLGFDDRGKVKLSACGRSTSRPARTSAPAARAGAGRGGRLIVLGIVGAVRGLMRPACPHLPCVIGHRGAAARAPENTLAGLRRAKALGCGWVEFDVRLTADGAPVLCHDAGSTGRPTGGGRMARCRCSESAIAMPAPGSARSSPASAMPTLDEALDLATELGLGTNIEIKSDRGRDVATAAAVAAAAAARRGNAAAGAGVELSAAGARGDRAIMPRKSHAACCSISSRPTGRVAPSRLGCATIGVDHRRLQPGWEAPSGMPDTRCSPIRSMTRQGRGNCFSRGGLLPFSRTFPI